LTVSLSDLALFQILNEATPSINLQHQDEHHSCIEKICGSGSRCISQDTLTQKTALHDRLRNSHITNLSG